MLTCISHFEQAAQIAGWQVRVVRRFTSFVEFDVSQGENALKIDLALDSPFGFAPAEIGMPV